ncbi:helix-turn-helix domain-containing protein [Nocardia sp. NPDC051911]|uniref:helix-turn-helix domain-containing protein n=1 Tax=Nocardia sp. NPDC051911 TaxID=3154648 RepID=UPI0034158F3C
MKVSDLEGQWLYYCLEEFMRRRRWHGEPIPDSVRRLSKRLEQEVIEASADEDETGRESAGLSPIGDSIGSVEAAAILGCSERWVRHIAADLDGIRIGHWWRFRRSVVEEYAQARRTA